MPVHRDDRYPAHANPETLYTGSPTGDLEDDLSFEEASLLDDLFTLEMWDEIEQYEAELGWTLSPQDLRCRVQAEEHLRGML